ncbi:MAG TPA: hypothetical protein VF624_16885 [Tepidisphaeraceae bacterium]|jgi:hypothetical protein
MDPKQLFVDQRLIGMCVYCGGNPETSDHAPCKALLDDPLPNDLPVVDACNECNRGFSSDEEFLACFLECVICGTTDPSRLSRPKIARTLTARPAIAALISKCREDDLFGGITWKPDLARVKNVVTKLARAHMAYELSLPKFDAPDIYDVCPHALMTPEQKAAFEEPVGEGIQPWPEIGSRAFVRACALWPEYQDNGWMVIQDGRYRYRVDQGPGGDAVRIVISEYLACLVAWA